MISKMLKMQMLEDDDELAYTPAETDEALQREADGRPGWMRILSSDLLEWSKMLPKVCANFTSTFRRSLLHVTEICVLV